MKDKPILRIVIPCYNEQEVLPVTAPLFREELRKLNEAGKIAETSRVLFVNDGSKDETWKIISNLAKRDEQLEYPKAETADIRMQYWLV